MRRLIKNLPYYLIAFLVVFGCKSSQRKLPSSGNPSPNNNRTQLEPKLKLNESSEGYQKVKAAIVKLKAPYRSTQTQTHTYTASDQEHTDRTVSVTEYDKVGRMRLTVNGEPWLITVRNKHYSNNSGKWKRVEVPAKDPLPGWPEWMMSLRAVQPAGEEMLDGLQCAVFTTQHEKSDGTGTTEGVGKMWVGINDGLPHQVEISWEYATKWSMTFDFNTEIEISEPAP